MPRRKKHPKIFVIDTSVILYDHYSIYNFEENDIVIPITVLEELDNFKKGNETKNFEARQFIRSLDELSKSITLNDWIELPGTKKGKLRVIMDEKSEPDATKIFGGEKKADHRILNVAIRLSHDFPDRQVILVSKDINLRLKAKSLEIQAADYETGKIKDVDDLYKGKTELTELASEPIEELYQNGYIPTRQVFKGKGIKPIANHFYILKNTSKSALVTYNEPLKRLERVEKRGSYGIKPRNAEQAFAINAILNPEIKLVTLQGVAGTGKTLLALAGAIEQRKDFQQIYLARPIVPLSNKDIGYLPGDVKSKLNPYMEPLYDNLKVIRSQFGERDKEFKRINEMLEQEKLVITPLAYIRGRSLSNIFFIVDEAQNLTPHEVKTIITRAGDNTKIVFTGDIFQIDTPYLDTQSNGLSYLIDRKKRIGQPGERPALGRL